jgi:hypothetical protein
MSGREAEPSAPLDATPPDLEEMLPDLDQQVEGV